MHLMLFVIFVCVALGLMGSRFGARQQVAIVFLASTMTALYFFVTRFM